MAAFAFASAPLEPDRYRESLADPSAGGYASFEGWVRDHNEGRTVQRLEYEAFESLAIKEGERIVAEAVARYGAARAACMHRVGSLGIGELAVWVGVSAAHRGEAFAACRYIIDEVTHRVSIWKKEHYAGGDSGWVNCERCATAPHHGHAHADGSAAPSAHDYSRQIALPEVGASGQARLAAASACRCCSTWQPPV
jgi:molybdopterin synthase catalytic subunit